MVCWELTVGWGQVSGVLGTHCGVGSGEWCAGNSLWGGVR